MIVTTSDVYGVALSEPIKLYLRRVPLTVSGRDRYGNQWINADLRQRLYFAFNDAYIDQSQGATAFTLWAKSRSEAKAKVRGIYTNARFYL